MTEEDQAGQEDDSKVPEYLRKETFPASRVFTPSTENHFHLPHKEGHDATWQKIESRMMELKQAQKDFYEFRDVIDGSKAVNHIQCKEIAPIEKQYMPIIEEAVARASGGHRLSIEFAIDESLKTEEQERVDTTTPTPIPQAGTPAEAPRTSMDATPSGSQLRQHLNPHYTFDNFIVGASNRMGHAAALAVNVC